MSGKDKLYMELTVDENLKQRNLLKASWQHFLEQNDPLLTDNDIFINEYNLMEVVERVSKRKYYYKVFHGLDHLSEFKVAALFCFWICKLKPFVVLKPTSPLCASVNELFAVHIVISLLEACKGRADAFRYPDKVTVKNIVYALKYQDLTKEALIQYTECLALACGIPIHSLRIDSDKPDEE